MAGAGAAGGAGTRPVTYEVRLLGACRSRSGGRSRGWTYGTTGRAPSSAVRADPEDLVDLVLLAEALGRPVWGFASTVRELGTRGLPGAGRPGHRR